MRAAQSARRPPAAAAADTTNPTADGWRRFVFPRCPHPDSRPTLALRDGEIDPDIPTEETALSCLDRVGQDRPGSEIDLVAVLTVGDDQVEVYRRGRHRPGSGSALAYRTSDCMVIAER